MPTSRSTAPIGSPTAARGSNSPSAASSPRRVCASFRRGWGVGVDAWRLDQRARVRRRPRVTFCGTRVLSASMADRRHRVAQFGTEEVAEHDSAGRVGSASNQRVGGPRPRMRRRIGSNDTVAPRGAVMIVFVPLSWLSAIAWLLGRSVRVPVGREPTHQPGDSPFPSSTRNDHGRSGPASRPHDPPATRHAQRQPNTSPRPTADGRIVDAAVLKIWILVSSVRITAIAVGES